ncbi:kinase-like domain-containing protein [Fusarium oxysporum]|nr:kinase-like domain-containing protein [Fusarium oxysporum]
MRPMIQGFADMPEPQGGHDRHLVSNHNEETRNKDVEQSVEHMARAVAHAVLASEKRGWRDPLATLVERYGKCQEVVGRGKFGSVFVLRRKKDVGAGKELYAVKKFQRQPKETERMCIRWSTAEFCISSALLHPNVISTLDLLKDKKGNYCGIMEFCSGGDLHNLGRLVGRLKWQEGDCFFKQMMRGVEYIYEMGEGHLDLNPKDLLLTGNGLLKISNFGHSECVRLGWESDIHMVSEIRGPDPYTAPK